MARGDFPHLVLVSRKWEKHVPAFATLQVEYDFTEQGEQLVYVRRADQYLSPRQSVAAVGRC